MPSKKTLALLAVMVVTVWTCRRLWNSLDELLPDDATRLRGLAATAESGRIGAREAPAGPDTLSPDLSDGTTDDANDATTAEEYDETPSAMDLIADPVMGGVPLSVNFSAILFNAIQGTKVQWDFGDGTAYVGEYKETHRYIEAGTYQVVATMQAQSGEAVGVTVVQVEKQAFPVQIVADEPAGMAPLTVHFSALAVAGEIAAEEGVDLRYEWQMGDGVRAFGEETDYTYSRPGTYRVTLEVIDDAGHRGRSRTEIYVLSEEGEAGADAPEPDNDAEADTEP